MPTRFPAASDVPSYLKLTITPPPPSSPQLTNVLVLLHGLGDTNASFTNLGRQLSLPETTCISMQGPTPLPFDLGGFHWGDDIQFDQASGNMDLDTGFTKTTKSLKDDLIEACLIVKCGYKPREIMIFGFGQGGMAALAAAASMEEELGGVASIGGPMPTTDAQKSSATPVLILGGSSDTLITKTAITKLKRTFRDIAYHKWNRAGDGMPQNREEMLPIMQFFARRLRSCKGVPEGSVEIG